MYGYVHSNPVAKSDSFGLWDCWTDEWGIEHCEPTDPTDPMPPERSYPSPECLARFDLRRVCDWYDYKTCCNVGVKRYNDDAKQECREEAELLMREYEQGIYEYWRTGPAYTECQQYVSYILGVMRPAEGMRFFVLGEGGEVTWLGEHHWVGVLHACNRVIFMGRPFFTRRSDATLDPFAWGWPGYSNRYQGSPCVLPGRISQQEFREFGRRRKSPV